MLVQDFVEIDVPFEEVISGLDPEEMGLWASAAYQKGERMTLGPARALSAAVSFRSGPMVRATESATIPIEWHASGATTLFPRMLAELIFAPLPDDSTQVGFRGSYEAPLDGVGKVLDRLALHRVAESTVRAFLSRLADALVAEISAINSDHQDSAS